MEVKIECDCGTKFKFDVEPLHGRMPMPVGCPECASDRTAQANQFIAQNAAAVTASVSHAVPVARINVRPVMAATGVAAPEAVAAAPQRPVPVPAGGLRIARAEPVAETASLAVDQTAPEGQEQGSNARPHSYAARILLERTTFFIKERVAVLKLTDTYDILDPANGQT